ncbi:hypothetical protein [Thermoanaerobacter uzonensis]|nr:hypothetical protein [Thermoanaerobacter sp. YS13]
MSELINNREYRRELLKEVIKELHSGKSVAEELCVYSFNNENLILYSF